MCRTHDIPERSDAPAGAEAAGCLLFMLLLSLPAWGANPVPFVNQPVVPGAVSPGGAQFTLTVNGTGFVTGSVVNWNGSPLVTTYLNQAQLTAVVPAANIASPGTASISVTSPPPGGGISNVVFLEVTNPVIPVFAPLQSSLSDSPSVVADFNGDGKLDLAANSGVLLGNGDGTFQAPLPYPSGFWGPVILAADFNGDEKLDLVTGSGVMLGNGDGTFQAPLAFPSGVSSTGYLAADVNGDGKLDLIYFESPVGVDGPPGEILVLLGHGDGTFADPLVSGSNPYGGGCQAIGDFNADGKLDLAIGYHYGPGVGNIEIWLGNGDGTFQIPSAPLPYRTLSVPISMIAADFNGDTKLDIAIGSGNDAATPGAEIFYGNGDGTFQSPNILTVANVVTLATEDVNGDGGLDLFADYGGSVGVLLNNGAGTFSALTSTYNGFLQAVGDFNGDGRMDFVAGNQVFLQSPTISGLPRTALSFGNQQVGTSSSPQTLQVQNTGSGLLTFTSIQTTLGFTETDNCQPSVLGGASCTLNVTFSPTTLGPLTGTLTLTDNASDSPQAVQLSGTGVLPAPNVSPLSLTFPNQLVGTTSAAQAVSVTNTGTLPLTFTSLSISSDWTQTNNCSLPLASSATCAINISFQPTNSGPLTGALILTDDSTNSPQMVTLTGTGLVPVVSLSAATLTFAGQSVSTTSAAQSITLTNTGTGTLTSLTITASGNFAQTNNCTTPLAVNAGCTVNVTFTPAAIGNQTGVLMLADNAGNSPQTVTLNGTGLGATASLSVSSLTFASQNVGTSSSTQQVSLQNTGNAALSITSINLGGSNSGDFSLSQTCGNSVAAGGNCALTVTFTPTSYGARTATISLIDNAADTPQTILLTGTGNAPTASLSTSSLTFPAQFVGTTGLPQNITLTNNGNVALALSSVQPSNVQFGVTNGCTSSLAVGVNCTISVFFDPSTAGTQTGTLTLTDSAPGSPQIVQLSGTGQDFTFTAPSGSSTSANAAPGQAATYRLSMGGEGGLSQTVTFACTGAPSEATCTVSPNPATASSSATNVTVSVTTTAPSFSIPRSRHLPPGPPLSSGLRVLLMLALALGGTAQTIVRQKQLGGRRWKPPAMLLAWGLLLTLALAACGGGGGGGGITNPGTPAGTYTLTVMGTAGSGTSTLSHSVTLTLTVS